MGKAYSFLAAITLVLITASVSAQEIREVGFFDTPGEAHESVIVGNYAFVGDLGSGFRVIDISDPENPDEIGFTDDASRIRGVAVEGNYAYVANERSGLFVIDISDPQNPEAVGSYDTPGVAHGVTIAGDYAYVADEGSGLRVINISNPENPDEVGAYDTPGNSKNVRIVGDYAYVADEVGGLRIIDISDPENPDETGYYDTEGGSYNLAIHDNYAYVGDGSNGFLVIDISNSENPREIGHYDNPESANGVAVIGNNAFLADGAAGLRIIDISNPDDPNQVAVFNTPGAALYVTVVGNYAYVGDSQSGLRILDVSDFIEEGEREIREIGFLEDIGAHRLIVIDDIAYVAGGDLSIVDVTNPEHPELLGICDTPIGAVEVAISENMTFVADNNGYLRAIDISDPSNPEEIESYNTPNAAQAVEIINDLAFVAVHQFGLLVIDISNPEQMEEVGRYNPGGRPYGMAVRDELVYLADLNGLLRIIDISDPENPDEISSINTPGPAQDVFVLGNYAYVANDHDGLCIIDISDPEDPSEVGSYDTPGQSYSVVVVNNFAFVADYESGLRVIDVSDPEDLAEVGSHNTPGQSYGIAIINNLAFVADGEGGLRILDVSDFTEQEEEVVWQINITSNVGGYHDNDNYAGVAEDATWGFDPEYDAPEAGHAPDGYVQLYFPHPEWEQDLGDNFTTDIVPDEAYVDTVIIWEFEVNTDQQNDTVTLTFNYDDNTPEEYNLVLLDVETDSLQNLRENDTYEYNSGEGGVHELLLIFGDQEPPVIEITAPNGGEVLEVGQQIRINWTAEDLTGIAMSEVSYSTDKGETFNVIDTTYGEGFELEWEIPDLYSPFCLIKVTCIDRVGNEGDDDSDNFFAIAPTISDYEFEAGWNLISLPLIPQDNALEVVFGDDVEGIFWVYDYRQERGLSRVDEVFLGTGYWLATMDDVSLDLEGTAHIDTVTFELDEGWNLLGDPLLWGMPLDSVLFRVDETTYSLEEAVDAELVQNILYNYQSQVGDYTEEDVLQPWLGYWFSALGEDLQMLLYPVQPQEEGFVHDETDNGTPESWRLTIITNMEDAADMTTTLGVDTLATDDFDAGFDYPEPPVPPGGKYVTAYFQHNDWNLVIGGRFNHDIRSDMAWGESMSWELTVVSGDTGVVTLSWPDIRNTVPQGFQFMLEDLVSGQRVTMFDEESYRYNSLGVHEFLINVEANVVDEYASDLLPDEFALISVYPNPFNNATRIRYGLPEAGQVSLKVYDISGRVVSTIIDRQVTAGHHVIEWDARQASSGLYLLQLEASNYKAIRKVVLTK